MITEESKRLFRVRLANKLLRKGIRLRSDKGASTFFKAMNTAGFNFKTGYLIPFLGYFLDGYDPLLHIALEFDTHYHLEPKQAAKDKERQDSITRYFESIGKPLKAFLRVSVEDGKLTGLRCTYGAS